MEGIKKGILKGFLELDEKLRKIPEVASGEDKSGTTAVCALISQVGDHSDLAHIISTNHNVAEIPDHCQLRGQSRSLLYRRQTCPCHTGNNEIF